MCGAEMREWSKFADKRNKIVDRITQECFAQDNSACTELRTDRADIERDLREADRARTACFDKTPDWRTYN